jgi:hypothetical protein
MKNNTEVKDTIIVIKHRQIEQCTAKGFCKNHPNQEFLIESCDPEPELSCLDSIQPDTTFVQANKKTFDAVMKGEVKHESRQEVVLTAFDTLQSSDNTNIQEDNNRLSGEFISIPEHKIEEPVQANLDLECLSLTFGFVVYLSIKYAFNSWSDWSSMFGEIKEIVNS